MKLAFRNILRHPVKNSLIGIVIILASLVYFFTGTLIQNSRDSWRQFLSTTFLGKYNITAYQNKEKDYTLAAFSLPEEFISTQIIEYLEVNGINYAKRIKAGAAVFNEETGEFAGATVTVLGVDWEEEGKYLTNLFLKKGNYTPAVANWAVVWEELTAGFGWETGDKVTLFLKDIDGFSIPLTFEITGIMANKTGPSLAGVGGIPLFPVVFVAKDYLEGSLGIIPGDVTDLAIWSLHPRKIYILTNMAKESGYQFFRGEQGFEVIWGVIGFVNFAGGFIKIFILTILAVATLNLNLLGFAERQKEIGTILAIGAKPKWVVLLLLKEMILFSVLAFISSLFIYLVFVLGASGGIAVQGGLKLALAGNKFYPGLVFSSVLSALAAIVGTMILSSVYPIYLSTRIDPVEVFREDKL